MPNEHEDAMDPITRNAIEEISSIIVQGEAILLVLLLLILYFQL